MPAAAAEYDNNDNYDDDDDGSGSGGGGWGRGVTGGETIYSFASPFFFDAEFYMQVLITSLGLTSSIFSTCFLLVLPFYYCLNPTI